MMPNKFKLHLLTLAIVTYATGLMIGLNIRPLKIVRTNSDERRVWVYVTLPQWPIGGERSFSFGNKDHYKEQLDEIIEHFNRNGQTSYLRPDLKWNLPICIAIVIVCAIAVEYLGNWFAQRHHKSIH
jgi:hypothetical protein